MELKMIINFRWQFLNLLLGQDQQYCSLQPWHGMQIERDVNSCPGACATKTGLSFVAG